MLNLTVDLNATDFLMNLCKKNALESNDSNLDRSKIIIDSTRQQNAKECTDPVCMSTQKPPALTSTPLNNNINQKKNNLLSDQSVIVKDHNQNDIVNMGRNANENNIQVDFSINDFEYSIVGNVGSPRGSKSATVEVNFSFIKLFIGLLSNF